MSRLMKVFTGAEAPKTPMEGMLKEEAVLECEVMESNKLIYHINSLPSNYVHYSRDPPWKVI